jgi:hypothetical protein
MMRRWFRRPETAPPAPADRERRPDWFAPAARTLEDLLERRESCSVCCIANSDAVPIEAVRSGLRPRRDLLCQYNAAHHAAALADPEIDALFFFHMTEREGLIHGLAPHGRPLIDVTAFGPGSRVCFLRSPGAVDTPVPDLGLPGFQIETDRLANLFFRPRPQAIPSAGFASVLLLHLLNLQRVLKGLPPHMIVLCGFTGQYRGTGYLGHDFHFEQSALATLPNVVRFGATAAPAASRLQHDLADIFHPGYDAHRRSKADMLFDIGKLHYAADDLEAFVDYIRSSAGLNPGFPQMQWLLRTLESMGDGPGEAAARSALGHLTSHIDTLRAHWTKSTSGGLGGAAFANEIDFPQAAYSIGTGERPRVLLVNETSKLPFNRWHLGCDHVSRVLTERLTAHGLDCVGWVNGMNGLSRILSHDPEAQFEAVVMNGEGTMHDNADRAFEIAAIGRMLQDLGKRVFLINTVWQGNGRRLNDLVSGFDLIAARESRSVAELAPVRSDVRLVPDLCWYTDLPRSRSSDLPIAVLDCVQPETTGELARTARTAGLPFFVMDRFFDNFHRAVRADTAATSAPRVLGPEDVGAASAWLGGRFHGVVLALAAGVPILSTPSNTHKITAMLTDIGIEDKELQPSVLSGLRSRADVQALFSGPQAYGASDWAKVQAYKSQARTGIDNLFADIASALA